MLLSKLVAGGLSAGVVLVWWPALSYSSGAGSWILRGVLWTCLFELLLLALSPLEETLLRTRAVVRVLERVPEAKPSTRRGAVGLGLGTILICGLLVVKGPDQPQAKSIQKAKVEKIIQQPVQIIRKTVVVRPSKTVIQKVPGKTVIQKVPVVKTRVIVKPVPQPSPKPAPKPSTGTSGGGSGGSNPSGVKPSPKPAPSSKTN